MVLTLPHGFRNSGLPQNLHTPRTKNYNSTHPQLSQRCKAENIFKNPCAYLAPCGVRKAVDTDEGCVADGLHKTPAARPLATRVGGPRRTGPWELVAAPEEEQVAGNQGYGSGIGVF
jgi:hypothetical protein